MRVVQVSNGRVVGGPLEAPKQWQGTTFGASAGADTYRQFGFWPVEVDDPGAGQWEQESNRTLSVDTSREVVVETVHYEMVPLSERKSDMRGQAASEYNASLDRGFSYDSATFPASGPKRQRVVELVAQINAGKGLPNGKSTIRFIDASGTAHDFNNTQIVELGAAGNDLVDAADDRLAQIEADIAAATSHSDLDALDVTSGWP